MIPYSAPPYGFATALRHLLGLGRGATLEQVEARFGEALGIDSVVLLPSARAGIQWALKAWGGSQRRVASPMFTCTAVWEAIFRAGAAIDGIDLGEDSFLLDPAVLAATPTEPYAVLLSEVYGHTYDLATLQRPGGAAPELRLVDLAGGVLHPALLSRLENRDVGLVSFGRGSKALYCGWGGMAFCPDARLGASLRALRAAETTAASRNESWEHWLHLLVVSVLRLPGAYGWKRRLQGLSARRRGPAPAAPANVARPVPVPGPGKEFGILPGALERRLLLHNLAQLPEHISRRQELARRYRQNLRNHAPIVLPPDTEDILSHFTIRVPGAMRQALVSSLEQRGIEAGRLFFFSYEMLEYRDFVAPSRFSPKAYPNTQRIASEVVNLPLFPSLSLAQVDWISETVRALVEAATRAPAKPLAAKITAPSVG